MKNKILIILAILFLISGCISQNGNPKIADQSLINKIQKDKTTKAEIETWFGEGGSQIRDGKKMWIYTYYYNKSYLIALYTKVYQIQVFYNDKNKVENFHYLVEDQYHD